MKLERLHCSTVALLILTAGCSPPGTREAAPSLNWDLSYERLRNTPDEEVEWLIVERASSLMGDRYGPEALKGLPQGVRAVYATWELEGQVNNGGFDQYFLNTEGALAEEAITGYRLFGAYESVSLIEQALAEQHDSAALAQLDDRFFELEEPVQELRIRYIRSHPEAF